VKLAVLNNCVAFVAGGAEHLAGALTQKLREYGHEAVLIRVPFRWEPPTKIIESMLACRLLRLPNVDRAVALKFPAYLVPHPEKMLWLLHQFRQAYDLWGTRFQGLPDTPEGRRIRDAIVEADTRYLRQVRKIYTNSQVTSDRLKRFNGIESEVLFPPLADTSQFFCSGYGDYILYLGRITASKRQHLAIEAMRHVTTVVRLVIAGQHEAPADLAQIETLIAQHGLARRVEVVPRFISEEEKVALLSKALACAYLPYDEDSYGYVTLEAYYSRKPMITCSDSGGVCTMVKDGVTGHVVPPDPRAVAAAMDSLYRDRAAARRMGEAGLELVRSLQISWDRVIEAFTR
jgi:glycosyltransferase involved in cell wall biosynthesis